MQLTIVAILLAATALALPAPSTRTIQDRGFFSDVENAVGDAASDVGSAVGGAVSDVSGALDGEFGANCSVFKCAAALGPEAVGCGSAAAQAFADPISDVACLATALNNVANKPAACSGCSL